jgi:hypothetical protein
MLQLVYCSQATTVFTDAALRTLLVKARANNTPLGITGCLLHVEGSFLQTLEGAADRVNAVFEKISRDRRHDRVLKLLVRDIEDAQFPDWSMGFVDGSGRANAIEGYRSHNGFGDLAGDATRVRQIVDGFRAGRWRASAA